MSEQLSEVVQQEGVIAERSEEVGVQSPPRVRVVEAVAEDPKEQLKALASEAAKRGSRKLLWEYLCLRSKVIGR